MEKGLLRLVTDLETFDARGSIVSGWNLDKNVRAKMTRRPGRWRARMRARHLIEPTTKNNFGDAA